MFSLRTIREKIKGSVRTASRNIVTVALGYIAYVYIIIYIIYLCIA